MTKLFISLDFIDDPTRSHEPSTNMAPRLTYQERAKRIAEFYIRMNKNTKKVVAHFVEEGVPSRTVHRVLRLFESRGDVAFKKIPGRGRKVSTEEAQQKIADLFRENPKMPIRAAADLLGVSRSTLARLLNEMRAENKDTFQAPPETAICPTCRQKCDPEVLIAARQKKTKTKSLKNRANENEDGPFALTQGE